GLSTTAGDSGGPSALSPGRRTTGGLARDQPGGRYTPRGDAAVAGFRRGRDPAPTVAGPRAASGTRRRASHPAGARRAPTPGGAADAGPRTQPGRPTALAGAGRRLSLRRPGTQPR